MMERPFAEWNVKFDTGVGFIDSQHKKLVQIMNELHNGLQNKSLDKVEVFRKAASQAVVYVKEHFSEEEAWMKNTAFPGLERQRHEHAQFVRRLLEDCEKFKEHNPKSAFDFVKFLRDWLLSHIAIEDNDFRFHLKKMAAHTDSP